MAFKDYHKRRDSDPEPSPRPENVVEAEYEIDRQSLSRNEALSSVGHNPIVRTLRLQGAVELAGVSLFLVGFFGDQSALLLMGGVVMIGDDLISVLSGALNPLFPVVFALILALVFDTWYLGVFWSLAVFKIFDIRTAWIKLVDPARLVTRLEDGS